ncbi:hypothetical protein ACHAWF_010912 [Thalassiosira exigua]
MLYSLPIARSFLSSPSRLLSPLDPRHQRPLVHRAMSSAPASNRPSWDAFEDASAIEYENRVEPFTSQFAEEMISSLPDDGLRQRRSTPQAQCKRKRLLDVGCGTGATSLLGLSRGFDVSWTDVSPAMVERTRQRVTSEQGQATTCDDDSRSRCRVADGQSLPAEWSGSFDVAVSNFSVIFFPDPTAGLKEMLRCLVPSTGVAAFSAWGDASETPAFRIFPDVAKEVVPDLVATGKPRRITGSVATLEALMEDAGFVDVVVSGPVTKTLVVSSPEEYYNRFALTSPPNMEMIASMDEETLAKFRTRIMETAIARGGRKDGSVAIDCSAYIAYGRRP